ncbi:MAG TPA: hypothetical protein VFV87_10425 [Pirellulaceae bacterium]|nr:hypothetical protein [Pirellulaceae bacterium]
MPGLIKQVKIVGTPQQVNKPTRFGPTIGHQFVVEILAEDIGNCRLQWWEKTERPYTPGMLPGVWCDLFALHPQSDVFAPWRGHVSMGPAEIQLHDPPGIMVSDCQFRELCFEIRVREYNVVLGTNNQRRIRARQVLRSDPLSLEFHIMENDFFSNAEDGAPTWG